MSVMNRANSLAFYELLGDAALMNTELDRYNKVTAEEIQTLSKEIFKNENSSTMYYYAEQV